MTTASTKCPCGSGMEYVDCCQPLHSGEEPAPTANALMRSRFSAFAMHDAEYLLSTWHPGTRPPAVDLHDGTEWDRLEIVENRRGGLFDDTGTVEFRAYFFRGGRAGVLHERSNFVRVDGAWRYVNGTDPYSA